jgi:hypothetical protein
MPSYRVSYEIDIEEDTPLEAALQAECLMQRENRAFGPSFLVVNSKTGESCVVDLDLETSTTMAEVEGRTE